MVQVDGVAGGEAVRSRRKQLVTLAAKCSAAVHETRSASIAKAAEVAEALKGSGNKKFQVTGYATRSHTD